MECVFWKRNAFRSSFIVWRLVKKNGRSKNSKKNSFARGISLLHVFNFDKFLKTCFEHKRALGGDKERNRFEKRVSNFCLFNSFYFYLKRVSSQIKLIKLSN